MINKFGNGIVGKTGQNGNGRHYEVLAVTSGKGGVGKSAISANMAIAMRQMNKKVLLVDADIHLGNVDLILGTRTKYSIADVVNDEMHLKDVIVKGPGNIDILPASSASIELLDMEDMVLRKLAGAFAKFDHEYEIIIIDTGAGIAQTVVSFLLGADKIVLIITPDPSSIADAYAVIKVVKSVNKSVPIFLTPNMVKSQEEGEVLFKKMNLMVQKFLNGRIMFGGSVLNDELISGSIKSQKPFVLRHPNSASANALRALNRRVLQAAAAPGQKDVQNNLFERLISNRKIKFEWDI